MEVGTALKKQEVMLFGFNLSELSEDCIASIFAFTTPVDVCRLALISRACNSAAESNVLWERFLPSDMDLIVSRSGEGEALLDEFPTKKQLYMRLADRHLLIDGATKSFWLDKPSGSKCLMMSARSLFIEWSDSPRFCKWVSIPESRFPEVAQLVTDQRLKIDGMIETSILSPDTVYLVYLVFKTTEVKQYLSLTPNAECSRDSSPPFGMALCRNGIICGKEYPKKRNDGWKEVILGCFSTHPGEDGEVELSTLEVERGNIIGSLIIEGIELRPR